MQNQLPGGPAASHRNRKTSQIIAANDTKLAHATKIVKKKKNPFMNTKSRVSKVRDSFLMCENMNDFNRRLKAAI